jgi:cytoskeletal protein RodZ
MINMTLKLNRLATTVSFAFASACATQPPPTTTTQTTTTQTEPTTPQSQPTTTTQTTTTQTEPTAAQSQPTTTTQTTTETQQTTSEPSATGQPAATQTGQVTKATAADIKAGASVYDQTGALVGKVVSVDADGAIVNTGEVRAEIPLSSFGKNDKGLVVSVTKAELNAKAKKETKPKS